MKCDRTSPKGRASSRKRRDVARRGHYFVEASNYDGEASAPMAASPALVAKEAKPLATMEALLGSLAFIEELLITAESTDPTAIALVSPIGMPALTR